MAVATSANFLAVLKQYHLLEPDPLAQAEILAKSFADAKALAGELIKRDWLTPYQVNQIFASKAQELHLGSYVLLSKLGEGGMGAVFKARNWKMNKIVALKLIRKQRLQNPDAIKRFHREIQAAAKLEHANIVRAFDADEIGGTHILVMEYVEGIDLSKLVKERGPLPVETASEYMRQAALGLQHACERGIVHRDIKPSNLLLSAVGVRPSATAVVKILDMGLARIERAAGEEHSSTLTETGAVMGTPSFMAPEQALSLKKVDIRADIYSLGCTFYYLLTGRLPFQGETLMEVLLKHREQEAEPVEKLQPAVPPGIAAVVRKMMAKKVEDRYQKPGEVAAVLAAGGEKVPVSPPPTPPSQGGEQASSPPSQGGEQASSPPSQGGEQASSHPSQGGEQASSHLSQGGEQASSHLSQGGEQASSHPYEGGARGGLSIGEVWRRATDPHATKMHNPGGAWAEPRDASAGASHGSASATPLTGESRKPIASSRKPILIAVAISAALVVLGIVLFWPTPQGKVSLESDKAPLPKKYVNSLGMEFALVPKGKSWLGGGSGKEGQEEVVFDYDFYLGVYEVTQEEWEQVMGRNPSRSQGLPGIASRLPVENVSWDDCQAFIKRVNEEAKEKGWIYRLPKEIEWEYACRGGPMQDKFDSIYDFYLAKPTNKLEAEQANFQQNGKGWGRTCKVGSYQPNKLGLYDMHGNVMEWCHDEIPGDPKDPKGALRRVRRGGCWASLSWSRPTAYRIVNPASAGGSNLGLRLALVPIGQAEFAPPKPPEPKVETVALPKSYQNSLGMEFALVPKGKSWLGGSGGKAGTNIVTIEQDFYLGIFEVTQEEWEKVMGKNPSSFQRVAAVLPAERKRFPVEQISWEDAQEFIKKVNGKLPEKGWKYRLPLELEWEYACRGGSMQDSINSGFDFYLEKPSKELLTGQANFNQTVNRTCKVGSYQPNSLGLFDMHGNVWEWCDNVLPERASLRVHRGGGWYNGSENCRAANRFVNPPSHRASDLGLRLARVPVGAKPPLASAAFDDKQAQEHQRAWADHLNLPVEITNSMGMKLVLIPPGRFIMGDQEIADAPPHEVEVTQPFYMAVHEVTVGQFKAFVKEGGYKGDMKAVTDPKFAERDNLPVVNVNWFHAKSFCEWLSKEEGRRYDLPTEAQWEYSCRAGTTTRYYFGEKEMEEHAWYKVNAGGRTHPVGQKKPNGFGIFDMAGNVWEWTLDWYDKDYYKNSPMQDPLGPSAGGGRVWRGGSWRNDVTSLRAAQRTRSSAPSDRTDLVGFRVMLSAVSLGPGTP